MFTETSVLLGRQRVQDVRRHSSIRLHAEETGTCRSPPRRQCPLLDRRRYEHDGRLHGVVLGVYERGVGGGGGVGGGQQCERRKVRHNMARNEHRPTEPTFRIELTVTYNNNNNVRANNTKNCIDTLSYMGANVTFTGA